MLNSVINIIVLEVSFVLIESLNLSEHNFERVITVITEASISNNIYNPSTTKANLVRTGINSIMIFNIGNTNKTNNPNNTYFPILALKLEVSIILDLIPFKIRNIITANTIYEIIDFNTSDILSVTVLFVT